MLRQSLVPVRGRQQYAVRQRWDVLAQSESQQYAIGQRWDVCAQSDDDLVCHAVSPDPLFAADTRVLSHGADYSLIGIASDNGFFNLDYFVGEIFLW